MSLRDTLDCLRPLHEAMKRFEQGGPARAQEIERLFYDLVLAEDYVADLEDELEELEDREVARKRGWEKVP